MMKKIAVIGSTGSIGQNTLQVVRHLSERFQIFALSAHSSVTVLADQIEAFKPQVVSVTDSSKLDELARLCRARRLRLPEML